MREFSPLPEKVKIYLARLSYSGSERAEVANWLVTAALALDAHPRVENVFHGIETGYPTPLVRNRVLATAMKIGCQFAVMVDDDMVPDVNSPGRTVGYGHIPKHVDQQNFFPSALDFALRHQGPCVVAAPYCAGPPNERVLVSRFVENSNGEPNSPVGTSHLECFTRDEAADRTGFEMVSALPTGLMLIDLRAMSVLAPPWFDYEYKDDRQTELASTEDTVFSRNLMYLDVPQYVAWSSWAGHVKVKVVDRPRRYPRAAIPDPVYARVRADVLDEILRARPDGTLNEKALAYLAKLDAPDDSPVVEPLATDESDS